MARTYKMRSFRNGQNKSGEAFVNYSVTLPTPVAEKLIEQFPDGVEFEVELTDEGILYKPVEPRSDVPTKLPFKRGKRSDNGTSAPAKPAAKAKPGPKPKATAAKPGPKPKATAKAKPGPKPKAKTATAKPAPKAAVRKPAAKAATAKPAAPKPRAPRPKAK